MNKPKHTTSIQGAKALIPKNGSRRVVETAITLAKTDRRRKWEDAFTDQTIPSRRWDDSETETDDVCAPTESNP
jgi:hypothetical protein